MVKDGGRTCAGKTMHSNKYSLKDWLYQKRLI